MEAVQRIAARSAGRPLGDATRAEMEDAFGYDFGLVRVHTDDAAAEVAQILDADAVSLGEDIYFAEGAYRPGDPVGKDLLAHELAHVAQHGDQAVTEPETRVSEEDDALEQIAGALSREVARGELAGPDTTAVVDRAARTIARRAAAQTTPQGTTEPSLPLGEMRIVERLAGILLGDFLEGPRRQVRTHPEHAGAPRRQDAARGHRGGREATGRRRSRAVRRAGARRAGTRDRGPDARGGRRRVEPRAAPGAQRRREREHPQPRRGCAGPAGAGPPRQAGVGGRERQGDRGRGDRRPGRVRREGRRRRGRGLLRTAGRRMEEGTRDQVQEEEVGQEGQEGDQGPEGEEGRQGRREGRERPREAEPRQRQGRGRGKRGQGRGRREARRGRSRGQGRRRR